MNAILKFLLFLLGIVLVAGVLFQLAHPPVRTNTNPVAQPNYTAVVPPGFTAENVTRVLDPHDAGKLMTPRLPLVKIADKITSIACPGGGMQCKAKALLVWTRTNIQHLAVLPPNEQILGPEETILYRQGDDTTMSVLLIAMLRAEGIKARMGITPYVTFVEATVGGVNVQLDPGCADCAYGDSRYTGQAKDITWVS